ncbi:MAG: FlgD immunoglobulin-like domain containing protein, partial [Christensenellales bacterium]
MMKKNISWMVFLLLMTTACAQAAPQLTNVTADGESLHAGEGWTVSFETTEGGALAMQLRGTEGETVDLGATQVDAGSGQLVWDGVLPDGSEAADGVYTVAVQLRNYWGEESEESMLPLTIGETNAAVSGVPDTLDLN